MALCWWSDPARVMQVSKSWWHPVMSAECALHDISACAEAVPPAPEIRSSATVFQHVEIRALPVTIDYLPRRLDLAALQKGRMDEVTWHARRWAYHLLTSVHR